MAYLLQRQRDGITGRIQTLGFPFATDGWLDPVLRHARVRRGGPYEQVAYWLDGAIRCARLLEDEQLASLPRKQLHGLLDKSGR